MNNYRLNLLPALPPEAPFKATRPTSASRSQDWNLDALGNWDSVTDETSTTQTRTHDAQNRLTQVDSNPLSYSPNGEMLSDETGQVLAYDAWGPVRSQARRRPASDRLATPSSGCQIVVWPHRQGRWRRRRSGATGSRTPI